jgi:hypothetical protein
VNGALQVVTVLMGQDGATDTDDGAGQLYLPFSVGRVDIWGRLADACAVHVRPAAAPPRSGPTGATPRGFDITVTDLDGSALVVLDDYALAAWPATKDR